MHHCAIWICCSSLGRAARRGKGSLGLQHLPDSLVKRHSSGHSTSWPREVKERLKNEHFIDLVQHVDSARRGLVTSSGFADHQPKAKPSDSGAKAQASNARATSSPNGSQSKTQTGKISPKSRSGEHRLETSTESGYKSLGKSNLKGRGKSRPKRQQKSHSRPLHRFQRKAVRKPHPKTRVKILAKASNYVRRAGRRNKKRSNKDRHPLQIRIRTRINRLKGFHRRGLMRNLLEEKGDTARPTDEVSEMVQDELRGLLKVKQNEAKDVFFDDLWATLEAHRATIRAGVV